MTEVPLAHGKYFYIHDGNKWPFQAIDTHHIAVQKSSATGFLSYLAGLLVLANAYYLVLLKENSVTIFLWSILLAAFLARSLHWKPVIKESVVVMPAFGVQLETYYGSGRVVRRFVPMGKILRPVLNECVTPVTCYWSLALILRGEEELMLVFQELRPPVKMLVPIWKALRAATDSKESPYTTAEDDR